MNTRVLCCVFNYNDNVHAVEWANRLSPHFDTLILDSGSSPRCSHPLAVPLDNIYYSGLMNEAFRRGKEGGYGWVMIVTSDIEISADNTTKLVAAMMDVAGTRNVGLYQPSTAWKGRSLPQSRCHFTGRMRSASFQEGWFHMIRMDLMEKVCPIDLTLNKLGWGVDLALSHFARIMGLLVLVDDRIRVVHPGGTGYGRDEALRQMRAWHATIPGYTSPRHFRPRRAPVEYRLIVSLTTWKARIGNIPAVLDTIFGQSYKPDLVVLNVAYDLEIPAHVQEYIDSHPVEVNRMEDLKVYKKLIPTLRKHPGVCVVSIDDDWLYPSGMLEDFISVHRKYPGRPVSGNHVHLFHTDFHCGCASLTRADYFGDSLELIDKEVMANCPSDDTVYTYFLKRRGYLYARTRHKYFINMTPYNPLEPHSPDGDNHPQVSWAYLCGRFGEV